jgi:hypothetical protein
MERSRRDLLSFALGAGAGLGIRASSARAAPQPPPVGAVPDFPNATEIRVGPGGAFSTVAVALASITDNGPARPYSIVVEPGIYDGFVMKPYVDVRGAVRGATTIETTSWLPVVAAANSTLANLRLHYSGASGGENAAALTQNGTLTEFVAHNLEVAVDGVSRAAGPRWAIGFFDGSHDATFYDIKITTESGGVCVPTGNYRFHSCDCYLTGNAVGLPHIGVEVRNGARVDWFGGRIGTGYYYDQDLHDPAQDVIGVHIPASNTNGNCRVSLHGVIMFARNIDAVSGVRVNAVRAENGWVRLFGCMAQSEVGDTNASKSIYATYRTSAQPSAGAGGKVEIFGSRVTDFEGNVFDGAGTVGVSTYDVSHDDLTLTKYEGGLILCDASNGPFSLFLASQVNVGDSYVFKKIDSTDNPVTIGTRNDRLIDGATERVLAAQYDTLRIVAGPTTYYVVS